jgi:hypothetical protein
LLCTWLGLPKNAWPPDAWTLLGVPREVCDQSVIEKRVQQCMCTLRNYQLSYPEEATEGMNRLAEAFITLTETCTKSKSAAPVVAAPVVAAPVVAAPQVTQKMNGAVAKDETATPEKTKTDWRAEPPPVRQEAAGALEPPPVRQDVAASLEPPPVRQEVAESPEPIMEEEDKNEKVLIAKPFAPPSKPIRRTIEQALVRELAEHSEEATSNLATLEAVIDRVDRTRVLLHVWDRLGKQLKGTAKKVSAKESDLFASRLDKIARTIQAYPPFLGQPGKPGYRVVVQARLRMPLVMVRGMSDEQREELLFDWRAGREVLLTHRKYLHRLFKSMRHRSAIGLFLHAIRAMVNDHPIPTLAGVVLLLIVIVGLVCSLRLWST